MRESSPDEQRTKETAGVQEFAALNQVEAAESTLECLLREQSPMIDYLLSDPRAAEILPLLNR